MKFVSIYIELIIRLWIKTIVLILLNFLQQKLDIYFDFYQTIGYESELENDGLI